MADETEGEGVAAPVTEDTSTTKSSTTKSSPTNTSTTKQDQPDLIPLTVGVCRVIQFVDSGSPLLILLDSGSSTTWFNQRTLPKGANPATVDSLSGTTMVGTFTSNQEISIEGFTLPEFDATKFLPHFKARVFNNDSCRYHAIVGRDVLRLLEADMSFKDNTMTVGDHTVPMRTYPSTGATSPATALFLQILDEQYDNVEPYPEQVEEPSDAHATMGDSTYDPADLEKVASDCKHLTENQRSQLLQLLKRHPTLFDGILRRYTGGQIHLDTDPSVAPKQVRY